MSSTPPALSLPEVQLLTVSDVAKMAQVSEASAWRWVRSGELTHVKLGRNVRVRESDLQVFLALKTQPSTKVPRQPGRPRKGPEQ